jgi:hypothetical protein
LRRACPNRANCVSPPRQGGEGLYSRPLIGANPRHEDERLQGGVSRAERLRGE